MLIYMASALPAYVVGIFLITVFAFHLEWLPMGGFPGDDFDSMESSWDQIRTVFAHALLPLIAYAIGDFAILTMTMKNSLMENLSAVYVRTAVAKGLPFRKRFVEMVTISLGVAVIAFLIGLAAKALLGVDVG